MSINACSTHANTPTGDIDGGAWAEFSPPFHPHFENEVAIRRIVGVIKSEISSFLFEGATLLFRGRHGRIFDFDVQDIRACWEVAIKSQRYGRIYLLSRTDAEELPKRFLTLHRNDIADIGEALEASQNSARLYNYAIHKYVRSSKRTIEYPNKLVPEDAFASLAKDRIAIRKLDFFANSSIDMLAIPVERYDLHDLAHQACATLCGELYGNQYFPHLRDLPTSLQSLITSEGFATTEAIPFSDGLVFSELLFSLFEALPDKDLSPQEIVDALAYQTVRYFTAETELHHPSTGKSMGAPGPISPTQLAVLVQNKFYELPASEIEQKLFTRGGKPDNRDPLHGMTTLQRIEFLSSLGTRWLYFEKRNTLRHRAQLETYRRVAYSLLATGQYPSDEDLLRLILDKITYELYKRGADVNLWKVISQRSKTNIRPNFGKSDHAA